MSIIKEAVGACCKCGGRSTIKIYRSINVVENPELLEKIHDGSLFTWECPHCGTKNLAKYETLYHDPARKLMVWLLCEGFVPEEQMQAIANQSKAMGGYSLRFVSNAGDLLEKVMIAEAGLDDCAVELCKYVTRMELSPKFRRDFSLPFHFYKIKGEGDARLLTFIYFDGPMQSVDVGINVYEDCMGILARNPQARPADGSFAWVDMSWVTDFIQ